MNKIIIFIFLISIELFANEIKYISIGFGNYDSDKPTDGFEFMMKMGLKDNTSKKYIALDNIFFEHNNNEEVNLLMYSLNYDYFYYDRYGFKPYLGAGINLINVSIKETITGSNISEGYQAGANIKTGFTYDLSHNWDINLGLKYIYINNKNIKYAYGNFIDFEFNF